MQSRYKNPHFIFCKCFPNLRLGTINFAPTKESIDLVLKSFLSTLSCWVATRHVGHKNRIGPYASVCKPVDAYGPIPDVIASSNGDSDTRVTLFEIPFRESLLYPDI